VVFTFGIVEMEETEVKETTKIYRNRKSKSRKEEGREREIGMSNMTYLFILRLRTLK